MSRPVIKEVELDMHIDDRGSLFEMVQIMAGGAKHSLVHKFGQVYLAFTEQPGIVRALHRHKEMWDWYTVPAGSAKILLYWLNSDSDAWQREEYVLTFRKPTVLQIPPTVYHGWCALEPKTMLLVVASAVYNRKNPDEERLPHDHFAKDDWEVKNR